ncbi:HTH-type transcriptional regulator RutR [Pluralibacter gergoviae]|nr:HTH-type transcriptional regulator RutR [Pluralibacter gergoviae]
MAQAATRKTGKRTLAVNAKKEAILNAALKTFFAVRHSRQPD